MTWSLVLGGAATVYYELGRAIEQFGKPDMVVAVKDIWIEYPKVDVVCTFHIDRIPNELARRRKLGYPDPKEVWTYQGVRPPKPALPFPVKFHKSRGGSSGLLGAFVGTIVADRAVLCGIPMDPEMPHYHNRKHGKPWKEGRLYKPHWQDAKHQLIGKVKSMSGWTKELLGTPTLQWVKDGTNDTALLPTATDTTGSPAPAS